jgi:hypothetical protein
VFKLSIVYFGAFVSAEISLWIRLKRAFNQFVAKLLIRSKMIKESRYSCAELNDMLATNFPQTMQLPLPGSEGQLILLNAELSMPHAQHQLHIQLYCSFSVSVVNHDIYRAHLLISGIVTPYYLAEDKTLRLKNMQLSELRLVKDDYAFINSTTELATIFMPKSFKFLLLSSLNTTFSLLKDFVPAELLNYLTLYSSGSKQKVLDFHHADIERLILAEIEQDDWCYPLDETDFEEQLFAEFGQVVVIENGHLVFKFHLD